MIYQNKWSCKDAKTLQCEEHDKTSQDKANQIKASKQEKKCKIKYVLIVETLKTVGS